MFLYNITLILFVLSALILSGWRVLHGALPSAFSKDQTLSLCGLLVLFVVVGHCDTLMPGSVLLSALHLGSPAVSVFLFLSGYGLVKLVDRTDGRIGLGFFVHSFVKLFVPFAVAVLLWYVYLLCSGKQCEPTIYWLPTWGGGDVSATCMVCLCAAVVLCHVWHLCSFVAWTPGNLDGCGRRGGILCFHEVFFRLEDVLVVYVIRILRRTVVRVL